MSNNSNWNAKSLEEKRALLTQLLQKKISAPSLFPLSLGQQALWFLYKLAPTSWAYNTLFTAHTPLGVDIPALRRAFQALIDRHPSLRTTYTVRDRNPLGQIHEQQEIYFKEINAATWSSDELNNYLVQEAQCPFDLEQGPLLRVSLFRTTTNYILMLAIHHIASDFWSLLILIDELGVLYPAQKAGTQAFLPTLNLSYADYVRKQAEMLAGGKGERLWTYWCHQLAGELPVLDLPTDYPRPPVQAYRGASYNFKLSEELTNRLKALAKAEKSTLYTLLLAAFQVLLHRYTSQEDILVGSPTSGRSKPEFSGIVGYFVNLVVLRTDLSGNPTFKTLLRQVRHTVLTALAHQDYPFPLLVERLQPNRDPSRSPIFQVSFALQKPQRVGEIVELFAPSEAGVKYDLGGLELEPFEMAQQEGQFDLTLEMMEARETLFGAFRYNTDLFDSATIARMVGHFQNLLAAIVADPTQKLSDLPLLSVEERQQLLTEWNRTTVNYPQDRCIHQLIEAIVERTPNAIAVVDSYQQLTYQQLNQKANCLAHHLIALGVKPEQLVGICLERSIDLVVGMLAILKAGGAYVPLEPSTPSERLAMMLEDANVALLLTQQHLYSKCSALAMTLVYVDAPSPAIATSSYENPESQVATENLAYAIYTSGSTGKPKAVVVEHRSLLNLVYWHKDAFSLSSGDRASSIASAAFDACGWELWSNLATGASIYIADDVTRSSPEKLQEWLIAKAITIAFVPTPLAESLFALSWSGDCALRVLLTGGDKITQVPRSVPFAIVNNYGPTENTVVTTSVVVTGSFNTVPPIGRPIANTQIYLLDEHLQILPIGVVGEIYIGGNSLARGYLNDPALSAARFIPNPFSNDPGARLYKTGDLARYRSDGNIQFVGRRDNQVKIRGVRIELGEIEAVLSQHPRLQNSIVLVREDIPDNKYLVAYVVANPPAPTSNQLRHFLQQKLPASMLPSSFILLDSLPLTPNGKVDWRSLPAPEKIAPLQHNFIAAQTPIQQMLVGIWAEVLQVEAVGIDDNFFDLGGHSLLATQIISRVRTNFNVELPLHSLFEFPTVLELAEEIETALRMGQQLPYPQLLPRTGQELAIQLSFAQTRLWFLEQIQPGSGFYNIPVALRLVGSLNLSALESSLNEIIRRHEALRTNFVAESGQPVQVIHHDSSLRLAVVDLRSCDETQRDSHCQRLATQEAMRPFDVERELLVRAIVFQLQRQECVLQLTMHHLVCDGWSMGILVRELASLYESFDRHLPIALLPLPIQYADFALWQRQWLQEEVLEAQLSYWKQQLQDAPALLELPTDRPRPAIGSFRGAHQSFTLSRELSAALNSLSQQQQVTLFMTLLAAFQTLLYRYSGQTDICVGSSIANRHHSQTESSIGLFVNTLVMHTNLSGNPSFQELLGRVREVALGAYAHQDLPFEQLVEALQPERSLSYQPLFQVMFVLQNAPMPALELPGLTLSSWEIDTATAKFDLTLSMSYSSGELVGTLEYNTDLFEADTINRMLGHFQTLLEGIVAHPEQRLADLPLLTLAQRQQLLVECNCTPEGAGIRQANECIHNLFEAQVKRTPEAIAIVFENEQLTYRELNKRANSLAHYLQTLDVKPEVLVGISTLR